MLGRILLSAIQLKTCLLNPHYVQDPEKIRVFISGPAQALLWLPVCVGAAWVCSVLLSHPERGLSQCALFVELYDLQMFAFLWSECGLNNDRLFWVAGWCPRNFVHLGCCVICYEWYILDKDGSGLFQHQSHCQAVVPGFSSNVVHVAHPPLLNMQASVAFDLLWSELFYLFLTCLFTTVGTQLSILSTDPWCCSVFLEGAA